MATTYAAGQQIAVQGVPNQRLSAMARSYVQQNFGSIGASQEDHDESVRITRQYSSGSNIQRIGQIEEARRGALEGKSGAEAERINRRYDLAIAFYSIHTQLSNASRADNDEAFELPSLSAQLRRSSTNSMPAGYGGSSYTPAGPWRERAENAVRERREAETEQRRSTMTPLEAALDALPPGDAAVKRMVQRANKEARANGVTDPAALVRNMRAAFRAQDDWHWTIDSSTADKAMDLIERAEAIAAERGAQSIFHALPRESNDQGNGAESGAPAAGGEAAGEEAAGGAGDQANGESAGNGGTTRSGIRVYGRRDGTPAPNPEEVPNLADEAQVRALQERLGVTVDGMYGPETHAAMLAAAQAQNKQPREFDFTVQDIWDGFIAALTGSSTGTGQATDGPGIATAAPVDLRTQLATQLAAVANLSDAPLSRSELTDQYSALQQALENSGLSQEKITEFNNAGSLATLTNGFLGSIEQALGMTVDSKADPRLLALLTDPTAGPIIASAINAGSITAVASTNGAGSPTVPGGNGGQDRQVG